MGWGNTWESMQSEDLVILNVKIVLLDKFLICSKTGFLYAYWSPCIAVCIYQVELDSTKKQLPNKENV